jgi:hypothetical protein
MEQMQLGVESQHAWKMAQNQQPPVLQGGDCRVIDLTICLR